MERGEIDKAGEQREVDTEIDKRVDEIGEDN